MAIISAEGNVLPESDMDEGCNLCKDFMFYFVGNKRLKEKFKEVKYLHRKFPLKVVRLRRLRQSHILLGNFIQMVDAWDDSGNDKEDFSKDIEYLRDLRSNAPPLLDEGWLDGEASEEELNDGGFEEEFDAEEPAEEERKGQDGNPKEQSAQQAQGQIHQQSNTQVPEDNTDTQPRTPKRPLSPKPSPGLSQPAKRLRLSNSRTRCIRFDSSVVFYDVESDSSRQTSHFNRRSFFYSRGRWAAPEGSQWLDTSGSHKTLVEFTGWIRSMGQWVPTLRSLRMDEKWEAKKEKNDEGGSNEVNDSKEGATEEAAPTYESTPDTNGQKSALDTGFLADTEPVEATEETAPTHESTPNASGQKIAPGTEFSDDPMEVDAKFD